jgi:ssDNA-binding Zn-finger/Zn-ribbon topoisomerase 1
MESDFGIEDFTNCPESSCDNISPINLDYYFDGERMFLSFSCPKCIASSLEDDFEWYVRCPSCHSGEQSRIGRVECVDGGVEESGVIWFECRDCGASAEDYPKTRWDSSGNGDVGFEPHPYK